nr:hypothetical protein 37 [bacterium]
MADDIKIPIGKAVLAVLVGISLLPVTIPIIYLLYGLNIFDITSVFTFSLLSGTLFIGVPVANIESENFPKKIKEAWLIEVIVGYPALFAFSILFNEFRPGATVKILAMVAFLFLLLTVITVYFLSVSIKDVSRVL